MKNLILVRGVSGSGKTTVANLFSNALVFSTDDYWELGGNGYQFDASKLGIAHKWNKNRVEESMKYFDGNNNNVNIVVHNTFTTEWEMKPYVAMAEKYGYRVHTIIVENRHNSQNVHGVPQETLDKQKNRFSIKL